MEKLNALFILPGLDASVGRNFTHIDLWRENGGRTIVAAFTRDGASKRERSVDVILGKLQHGKMFSRVAVYKEALDRAVSLVQRNDIVFVYTLDNFVLAWMAKVASRKDIKIVYFLMDVREKFIGSSLFTQITQRFLLFAFERCEMVVVSSRYYIEEYAAKYLQRLPENWREIENKVDKAEMDKLEVSGSIEATRERLVIGYFGVIRCNRSLEILLEWAKRVGSRGQVLLRGIFVDIDAELLEQVQSQENIEYTGPYQNPEDLPLIYQSCDVVWACYPYSAAEDGNYRWAKTNRFYESGYFNRPIIASQGTKDAEYVARSQIGLVVDLGDVPATVHALLQIDERAIDSWEGAYQRLPGNEFAYSEEFRNLYRDLQGPARSG